MAGEAATYKLGTPEGALYGLNFQFFNWAEFNEAPKEDLSNKVAAYGVGESFTFKEGCWYALLANVTPYKEGVSFANDVKVKVNSEETRAALCTENNEFYGTVDVIKIYHVEKQMAPSDNPFTDVKSTDWFYSDVMFAYENNLLKGMGDGTLAPKASATRAQVSAILHRYAEAFVD